MNDIEKAFYDPEKEEKLKILRERANKFLPILKELVETDNDPEFTGFVQAVIDSYMMNECELGRLNLK